jgi:ABC-type Fe3+-hydroxamate transport system substrate-binding protein
MSDETTQTGEPIPSYDDYDWRSPDDSPHVERVRFDSPVPYIPRRVVSLVPSVTESLFDLDLGDRLIAVTDYCVRPEDKVSALTRVGGTKNPDVRRILELQPDLVIMNREENRREDADVLRAAGIPIWDTYPRTVREAIDLLWHIMDVFEHGSMTERVRSIEITYEITLKYMTAHRSVRTFCPIWRDPLMTFNSDTYMHDLLHTIGAENVFADRDRRFPLAADLGTAEALSADDPRVVERDTRYPRITLDEVIAAQPELILLPSEPYEFTESDAAEYARLDIPAAKNGHIHCVDGSLLSWHGTRLAYALRDLPPLIASVRGDQG